MWNSSFSRLVQGSVSKKNQIQCVLSFFDDFDKVELESQLCTLH